MKSYLSRKEKIKIKAIEIIYNEGIQALSVKNIATQEGIAQSLLYKYYEGMEELLKEVIIELGKFDERIYISIEASDKRADRKIIDFVETLGEYYENYPEVTPLLNSYEFFRSVPQLEKEIFDLLEKQREYIRNFVITGIDQEFFKKEIDAKRYSTIIIGSLREEIFQWRLELQKGGVKDASLKIRLVSVLADILCQMKK